MSYIDFNYEKFTQLVAPTNINIHPGYTSVSANWNIVDDATQYIVTITSDTGTNISINTVNNYVYIESGLSGDETYKMTVLALNGDVKGPYTSKNFTTLVKPQDIPETSPVDVCSCIDKDCSSCVGKPVCVNGNCAVCDPNTLIPVGSECYNKKYVCVPEYVLLNGDEGPSGCYKCHSPNTPLPNPKGDISCKMGYGDNYYCNTDTGTCEEITSVDTDTKKSTNWKLIIGIIVGILILLSTIGIIIFMFSHKPKPTNTIVWPVPI